MPNVSKSPSKRSAIVVSWAATGKKEVYSSLKLFLEVNPGHVRETIEYHTTRNNQPYVTAELSLERCPYITPQTRARGA